MYEFPGFDHILDMFTVKMRNLVTRSSNSTQVF